MGQKVNPVGFRLAITKNWYSRWYADRANYQKYLHEDLRLRRFIKGRMYQAGISTIDIERTTQRVIINIHSAKPGMIIGKRGVEIEQLRGELQKRTGRQVFVNIHEVRVPEVDAQLVSENIAGQMEKRVSYRRIVKKAALLAMRAGAKGIKTSLSGRLAGAEIARYHRDVLGKVPLHTMRAEIDYGHATSFTAHGTVGVKVWMYKGDTLFSAHGLTGRTPAAGAAMAPRSTTSSAAAIAAAAAAGAAAVAAAAAAAATPATPAVAPAEPTAAGS